MGYKVPNSLLKSLCVRECDNVGGLVLFLCMYVCDCVRVCMCKVKRGMWNSATNTMKNVTENSFCGVSMFFSFQERTQTSFFGFFFFLGGGGCFLSHLGHTGAACRRRTHLSENLVQPLQGTIQMQLYPARSACDSLSPVLGPPAFDKAHAYGAHPGKLIDSFKALVDRLSQQGCKFLVVKYF